MSGVDGWLSTAVGRHPVLGGVTVLYVAAWTVFGIATGTGQVYTYLVWMVCAVGLVMYVDGRVRFSTHALALLSIVGFCHMAGGNLYFGGVVLYEQVWLGFIRYDHLIHAFGLGAPGWPYGRRHAGCWLPMRVSEL
ncbi:MAG: hypothetical protein OXJ36_16240 [bacterium]|nr:hypothetical protein [bacterium]MDE0439913.1 hypothetical protein [bacterium]